MASIEERVSRLEGGFDHLATKAEVANLKVWIMGLLLTAVASSVSLRRESARLTTGLKPPSSTSNDLWHPDPENVVDDSGMRRSTMRSWVTRLGLERLAAVPDLSRLSETIGRPRLE